MLQQPNGSFTFLIFQILLKKLECYKIELDQLIESSKAYPNEEEMKNNLTSLNKKLSSLILRTEHQIAITKASEFDPPHSQLTFPSPFRKLKTIMRNIKLKWKNTRRISLKSKIG
jgi:hypothetical protein